jgi:hypothetical protein
MTEYIVICVDRSAGDDGHNHIYQALVRPATGGVGRLLPVKDIRREIKLGVHRYFSTDPSENRIPVKRYKCQCGYKTIRTKPDDIHDNNLSRKGPCT